MPLSKIKDEYKDKKILFGKRGKGLPLGEREDIDDLAIIAIESKDRSLLRLFETLPDLAELKKSRTDVEIAKAQQAQKQVEEIKKQAPAKTPRPQSIAKAMSALKQGNQGNQKSPSQNE